MRLSLSTTFSSLSSLSRDEWARLFRCVPESFEMHLAIERGGFKDFTLGCLVVRREDRAILALPTFETSYDLLEALGSRGWLLRALRDRLAPRLGKSRMLGAGMVSADVSYVGFDMEAGDEILEVALIAARRALEERARRQRRPLMVFVDLDEQGGSILNEDFRSVFAASAGVPYCVLPIEFGSLDQYFAKLSKATRKDLRRKLRSRDRLRVEHTRDAAPHLAKIYEFYLQMLERCSKTFGVHGLSYFEEVCQICPGAEYVLYFEGNDLVGFNLVEYLNADGQSSGSEVPGGRLIDRLFCMEPTRGQALNLYFLSWIYNVEVCIARGISVYLAGADKEELKSRLGAEVIPCEILLRHLNPVVNWILRSALVYSIFKPEVPLRRAALGGWWRREARLRLTAERQGRAEFAAEAETPELVANS